MNPSQKSQRKNRTARLGGRPGSLVLAVLMAIALPWLAGCAPEPTATPVPTEPATPTPEPTATPTAAASGFLEEDFESGSDAWTTQGGTWSLVEDESQVLQQENVEAFETFATAGDLGWTDYTVTARIKVLSGYGGLLGRFDKDGNTYLFDFGESTFAVWRRFAGGWTAIVPDTEFPFFYDTWHTVRLVFSGNQITLFIDGVQQGEPITDNLIGSGKMGFRTSYGSIRVDDVIVE